MSQTMAVAAAAAAAHVNHRRRRLRGRHGDQPEVASSRFAQYDSMDDQDEDDDEFDEEENGNCVHVTNEYVETAFVIMTTETAPRSWCIAAVRSPYPFEIFNADRVAVEILIHSASEKVSAAFLSNRKKLLL